MHHPLDLLVTGGFVIESFGKARRSLGIDGGKGVRAEHPVNRREGKGVVTGHAMGNRAAGQLDVVGQLTQQRKAAPAGDACQYRLKQLAADRSWQHPVVMEYPVFQVAHVAAAPLVASRSDEQTSEIQSIMISS